MIVTRQICRIALLPALLAFARPAAAQPPGPRASIPDIIAYDVRTAVGDALAYFTSPLTFTKRERLYTAGVIGGTAWLMSIDEALNRSIADVPQDFLRKPLEWAGKYGNLRPAQYASAGLYLSGLLVGSEEIRVTGRLMGEGLIFSGIPVILLQYTLGRGRPGAGGGAGKYHFFEWSNEKQSFPSGHTAVAFTISTVLSERLKRTWISVPLYTVAAMSGYSLLRRNQHWTSDVVIGALFGYLGGRYAVAREDERRARATEGASAPRSGAGDDGPRIEFGVGGGGLTARWYILD